MRVTKVRLSSSRRGIEVVFDTVGQTGKRLSLPVALLPDTERLGLIVDAFRAGSSVVDALRRVGEVNSEPS